MRQEASTQQCAKREGATIFNLKATRMYWVGSRQTGTVQLYTIACRVVGRPLEISYDSAQQIATDDDDD